MWTPRGRACWAEKRVSAKVLRWEHEGAIAGMERGRGKWKARSQKRGRVN